MHYGHEANARPISLEIAELSILNSDGIAAKHAYMVITLTYVWVFSRMNCSFVQ